MKNLYVKVGYPEIQDYRTYYEERYIKEIMCTPNNDAWFVPLDLYNEMNKTKTLIVNKDGDVKASDLFTIAEQLSNNMVGGSTVNTSWILQ